VKRDAVVVLHGEWHLLGNRPERLANTTYLVAYWLQLTAEGRLLSGELLPFPVESWVGPLTYGI